MVQCEPIIKKHFFCFFFLKAQYFVKHLSHTQFVMDASGVFNIEIKLILTVFLEFLFIFEFSFKRFTFFLFSLYVKVSWNDVSTRPHPTSILHGREELIISKWTLYNLLFGFILHFSKLRISRKQNKKCKE